MGRNKKGQRSRAKKLTNFSINKLFEIVVKVRMFGKDWVNGQDGYFYQLNSESIDKNEKQYIGIAQPISFVYKYMQAGFDVHGNMICYRVKHNSPYSKGKSSLVWQKKYRK